MALVALLIPGVLSFAILAALAWRVYRRRRRPRVEPLPNPPWSVRDQEAAIRRAREDWLR
jgi:hypothetical protein